MNRRFIVKMAIVCAALAAAEVALVADGHRWLGVGLAAWTIAIWIAAHDEGVRQRGGRHRPDHH